MLRCVMLARPGPVYQTLPRANRRNLSALENQETEAGIRINREWRTENGKSGTVASRPHGPNKTRILPGHSIYSFDNGWVDVHTIGQNR
jgi:hypothetical protein